MNIFSHEGDFSDKWEEGSFFILNFRYLIIKSNFGMTMHLNATPCNQTFHNRNSKLWSQLDNETICIATFWKTMSQQVLQFENATPHITTFLGNLKVQLFEWVKEWSLHF